MKTVTSAEAQRNFGALIDLTTSGEAVRVTRHGRPAVLMVADNEAAGTLVRQLAGRRLTARLESLTPQPEAEALTPQDIDRLIAECFD